MGPSITKLLLVALVVVLIFGSGRLSSLMGDVAKGIKAFRRGLADDPSPEPPVPAATTETPEESRKLP